MDKGTTSWIDQGAFVKLTKFRLNGGGHSGNMRLRSEQIVNRVIGSAGPDKGRLFSSGPMTHLFEITKI